MLPLVPIPSRRLPAPTRLLTSNGVVDVWMSHAAASVNEVGAMLLGGRDGLDVRVLTVQTLTNIAPAPRDRFEACPLEFARALLLAESQGMQLLGFGHSHPRGLATPSAADRAAAWPEHVLLLAAPATTHGAPLRAFWRDHNSLREIAIVESARVGGDRA